MRKNNEEDIKESISVIIPVYKSALILEKLCQQIHCALVSVSTSYEIIMVEDGAFDGSWAVIESLTQNDPRIKGIRLSRNHGQHNALLCGIRAASYPIIVTIDDDLQHPPQEIPKLLHRLREGYDVVYGTPEQEQHNFWRDQASKITKIVLQSTMGAETARHVSAFRIFRTTLRDAFKDYRGPFVSIDVLLTWGTTRFSYIQVRHEPRTVGTSNYTFRKLFNHAMNMMTGFSTLPLQIASIAGFGFTLVGIVILLFVTGQYLFIGDSVPGFPFLASIIAIFSGAQLFAIGIIGEYLARMHFRSMERPTYTISERTHETTAISKNKQNEQSPS